LEPVVIGKISGLVNTPDIETRLKTVVTRRMKATATKTNDTKSLRQR
jgi:hypothetical protein